LLFLQAKDRQKYGDLLKNIKLFNIYALENIGSRVYEGEMECSRIMVIDDDPFMRDNLAELFELKGYSVQQAGSGKAGLKLLQNVEPHERPFAIIVEQKMPLMRGSEFLRELLQQLPEFARKTNIFLFSTFRQYCLPPEPSLKVFALDKDTDFDSLVALVESKSRRLAA
jgi:CheY-like chemotaxis protein